MSSSSRHEARGPKVTKKTLEKAIQEFRTKCKNSMDEYHSQVRG